MYSSGHRLRFSVSSFLGSSVSRVPGTLILESRFVLESYNASSVSSVSSVIVNEAWCACRSPSDLMRIGDERRMRRVVDVAVPCSVSSWNELRWKWVLAAYLLWMNNDARVEVNVTLDDMTSRWCDVSIIWRLDDMTSRLYDVSFIWRLDEKDVSIMTSLLYDVSIIWRLDYMTSLV